MGTMRARRLALAIAAPVLAIAFAVLVTSVVLVAARNNPIDAFSTMTTKKNSYKYMQKFIIYISILFCFVFCFEFFFGKIKQKV